MSTIGLLRREFALMRRHVTGIIGSGLMQADVWYDSTLQR